MSHPDPVVLRPAKEQGSLAVVGRKEGAASYSVFRLNAKEQRRRGQVSTATLRLVADA